MGKTCYTYMVVATHRAQLMPFHFASGTYFICVLAHLFDINLNWLLIMMQVESFNLVSCLTKKQNQQQQYLARTQTAQCMEWAAIQHVLAAGVSMHPCYCCCIWTRFSISIKWFRWWRWLDERTNKRTTNKLLRWTLHSTLCEREKGKKRAGMRER